MSISAPEEVDILGRGTGKTEGILAPSTAECVFSMPRSMGVFGARTYQQLITRTLPSFVKGLYKLGYVQDRDYFFGHFAPKKLKWDKPFTPPLKPEHFFHFRNGTGIALVSQDRPGSANGLNIDWGKFDEAKYLNKQQYESEIIPAMRGNLGVWPDAHLHHGMHMISDMPETDEGKWILRLGETYEDPDNLDKIELVLSIQYELYHLRIKRTRAKAPRTKYNYGLRIKKLEKYLFFLRKGDPDRGIPPLRLYLKGTSFDNIEALGLAYFLRMRRTLPKEEFNRSILNKEPNRVIHGFYPDLDESVHSYVMYDNSYLDTIAPQFNKIRELDSRQDADVIKDQPLHMAMDYGGSFNCMVVGQPVESMNLFRVLNNLYRYGKGVNAGDNEGKLVDVVSDFKRYYVHHRAKKIYYYYDHTATGTNAMNDLKYYQVVIDELMKEDRYGKWEVVPVYIGNTYSYPFRLKLWSDLARGSDALPVFRFNKFNAHQWYLSCINTPMKEGSRGPEKVKTAEKVDKHGRYKVDQAKAPHLSDAGDTLITGLYGKITRKKQSTAPPSIIRS